MLFSNDETSYIHNIPLSIRILIYLLIVIIVWLLFPIIQDKTIEIFSDKEVEKNTAEIAKNTKLMLEEFRANGDKSYTSQDYIIKTGEFKNEKEDILNNLLKEIDTLKEEKEKLNQSLIRLTNENYEKNNIINHLRENCGNNNVNTESTYIKKIKELEGKRITVSFISANNQFYLIGVNAPLLPYNFINEIKSLLSVVYNKNKIFIDEIDGVEVDLDFTIKLTDNIPEQEEVILSYLKIKYKKNWNKWYKKIFFDYNDFCKDAKIKLQENFKISENFKYTFI